jgi:hypothetical protein
MKLQSCIIGGYHVTIQTVKLRPCQNQLGPTWMTKKTTDCPFLLLKGISISLAWKNWLFPLCIWCCNTLKSPYKDRKRGKSYSGKTLTHSRKLSPHPFSSWIIFLSINLDHKMCCPKLQRVQLTLRTPALIPWVCTAGWNKSLLPISCFILSLNSFSDLETLDRNLSLSISL